MLNADKYTPVDDTLITTGEIAPVEGTPLDFRKPTAIGERVDQLTETSAKGYDHNFVINRGDAGEGELVKAAELVDPASGRTLTVLHRPAGHPVLRRQLPERREGQGRQDVRPPQRLLPGNAGVPRLAQQAGQGRLDRTACCGPARPTSTRCVYAFGVKK